MKQRIKYIALMLLSFGMLLTSCKDYDDLVIRKGDNGGVLSDRDRQFSFNFQFAEERGSRAADPNATDSERHVNSVRVVLYEGKQQTIGGIVQPDPNTEVLYAFDYYVQSKADNSGFEEWSGVWPNDLEYGKGKHLYASSVPADASEWFTTYARKVGDRNYYMLVILNAYMNPFPISRGGQAATRAEGDPLGTRLLELTAVGRKLSDFTQAIPMSLENMDDKSVGGPAADSYFLMTNANGLTYVPNDKLGDSEQDAHDNPVEVAVERAVSKIKVKVNTDVSYPSGAEVGTMSWGLVNTNKFFYWMRKPTYVITASGEQGTHELAMTPPPGREFVYAEDPNFSGFSIAAGGTVSGRREQFNTVEEVYSGKSPTTLQHRMTLTGMEDDQPVAYTLENTMNAADQVPEVIPQTVIAVPYMPNTTYSWTDGEKLRLDEGYFIFNNVLISFDEMEEYATDSESIVNPRLADLADAIAAVTVDAGIALNLTNVQESDEIEPFDEYGLKYYRYGVNYYTALIKHYNADPLSGYGRYGVVRNNYYTVNIKEITGPGSPVIHRPVFISAEVEIMEWLVNRQDESDLGEEIGDLNKRPIVTIRYLCETYGWYDPELSVTRAAMSYGWSSPPILFATDYVRYDVGDVITDDDLAIRNKYLDAVRAKYVGSFQDGAGEIPFTVMPDNESNVINITYLQNHATVDVYYYDYNDPTVNIWHDYTSYLYGEWYAINSNTLDVPHGFVVDINTPFVRYDFDIWAGWEKQYYDFSPYVYSHSEPDGGVTSDYTTPQIFTLYYTKPVQARVWMAAGFYELWGQVFDKDNGYDIAEGEIEPILLPVNSDNMVDVSSLPAAFRSSRNGQEYKLSQLNERYVYGTYMYLENEGWVAVTFTDAENIQNYINNETLFDDSQLFGVAIPVDPGSEFLVPYQAGKDIVIFYGVGAN